MNSKTIKTANAPFQTPAEIAAAKEAAVVAPLLDKLAAAKAKADAKTTKAAVVEVGGREYAADVNDAAVLPTITARPEATIAASGPHNDGKNAPVRKTYHSIETPPVFDTARPIREFNRFGAWYATAADIQLARPVAIFLADPKFARGDKYEHARIGTAKMTRDASPYSVKIGDKLVVADSIFVNASLLGDGDERHQVDNYFRFAEFLMHRFGHLGNAAQGIKDVKSKGYHTQPWVASCDVQSGLESLDGKDRSLGQHETVIRPEFAEKIMSEFKPDFAAFNMVARYATATTRQNATEANNGTDRQTTRIALKCPDCGRMATATPKPALYCGCKKVAPVLMKPVVSKKDAEGQKAKAKIDAIKAKEAKGKGGATK